MGPTRRANREDLPGQFLPHDRNRWPPHGNDRAGPAGLRGRSAESDPRDVGAELPSDPELAFPEMPAIFRSTLVPWHLVLGFCSTRSAAAGRSPLQALGPAILPGAPC